MSAAVQPAVTQSPVTVLLVDDTADIRFLLRLAMDLDRDLTVVGEAQDGLEALEVARTTRPDLVVLDLSMPRMDGLTVLPQLRRLCPDTTILVLSGFDGSVLGSRAMDAGADGYLRKGASPREIVDRARQLRGLDEADSGSARATRRRGDPGSPAAQWSVPADLLQEAPFGLLAMTVGRRSDDRDDPWVSAANDVARAALRLSDTVLPAPLAQISPALDDMVRSGRDGAEERVGQDTLWPGEPLGDRDDLAVRLHRDGSLVTAVLMPLASTAEATRLRRAIASVAHEMRNPVTILVGATHAVTAGRGLITSEVEDRLFDAINRQARQLDRATADLITTAQRHAGPFDVHIESVRLAPALEGCVAAQPELADVVVDCPGDLWVRADPGRLDQVVVNLLSNALKYGAEPVTVTVSETPDAVSIHVSDSGAGVSPDFAPRLFDEFAREGGALAQGTGLGLHVVRSLAEAQRGTASYSRTDDRTRFTVSLPRAAAPGPHVTEGAPR